jgi:hypothetical protein
MFYVSAGRRQGDFIHIPKMFCLISIHGKCIDGRKRVQCMQMFCNIISTLNPLLPKWIAYIFFTFHGILMTANYLVGGECVRVLQHAYQIFWLVYSITAWVKAMVKVWLLLCSGTRRKQVLIGLNKLRLLINGNLKSRANFAYHLHIQIKCSK